MALQAAFHGSECENAQGRKAPSCLADAGGGRVAAADIGPLQTWALIPVQEEAGEDFLRGGRTAEISAGEKSWGVGKGVAEE